MKKSDLFSRMEVIKSPELPKFLKWGNTTIGIMSAEGTVKFTRAKLNKAVQIIIGKKDYWFLQEYKEFLEDRVPSKQRRDIESILRYCGLSVYNVLHIAAKTRAINAKDHFWLAFTEEEKWEEVFPEVFSEIFSNKKDMAGEIVYSPEGVNVKRYAVSKGQYGILKDRLHPYSSDVESEVAVYNLGKLLGVEVCPAWLVGDKSFSAFQYNFLKDFLVSARRVLTPEEMSGDLYKSLIGVMPEFKKQIRQMIILDFLTRQTDRHMSNLALLVSGDEVYMYPLYDNGRSLFYEDREELMSRAVDDIELYSSEFGGIGTYWDAVHAIMEECSVRSLVNLNITKEEISKAYDVLPEERKFYAVEWTMKCLGILKGE